MKKSLKKISAADIAALQAKELSEQFKRAQNGLVEVVRFGAMLVALDEALSGPRCAPDGSQDSLASWLAEHCPEIPYKTAMGYKRAAEGFRAMRNLGTGADLVRALESPEGRGAVDGCSLRMLQGRGGKREGAGRKKLIADGQDVSEAALAAWMRLAGPLNSFTAHRFSASLDRAFAKVALEAVTALRDDLVKRVRGK